MGSVAARDIFRFAGFLGPVGAPQPRQHPLAIVFEAEEFGSALDLDPRCPQPLDEKPLVLVLRKYDKVRERAQTFAQGAKGDAAGLASPRPQIGGCKLQSFLDHRLRQS